MGPAVDKDVASTLNALWGRGRSLKVTKQLTDEYPRPENLSITKVKLNEEVQAAINKNAVLKDQRCAGVQSALAVGALPLVKIVDGLKAGTLTENNETVKLAFNALTLISHANAQLNQLRRDMIKPGLNSRYRSICAEPPGISGWLFGDDLEGRCKKAQTAAKLSQSITASNHSRPGLG